MSISSDCEVDNVSDLREKMVEKFLVLVDGDYKIAKNLEIGCYNSTLSFADTKGFIKMWDNPLFKKSYIAQCISIFTNLDPNSYVHNPNLLEKVKTGEVRAFKVGSMKPEELYPEHWEEIKIQKEKRDKLAFEIRTEHTVKGMYKCSKCKNDRVTYYQLQTRSSDEPMTTFINCTNCGKRWKN